jgi:sulfate permease, SulP family
VLVLGVLPGLIVAAGLSLVYVMRRFGRPSVGELGRDPVTGAWARVDRREDWEPVPGVLVVRSDGPLLYANAVNVKEHILALVRAADPRPGTVVVDLSPSADLDVETVDALAELDGTLGREGIELRLGAVHAQAAGVLRRSGLADRVRVEPTIDAAIERASLTPRG